MNTLIQDILVYLITFSALAYLAYKFLVPSRFKRSRNKNAGVCGKDDCGCH
ncbi:hypothetical protein [Robertkochia flava]|uniref:hypothetical protein n=1 Tax=Robertkochia flava TaxID=3447986 RepID=UPI001CC9E90A|nr:hypothetical protein [Robertkochia marina]